MLIASYTNVGLDYDHFFQVANETPAPQVEKVHGSRIRKSGTDKAYPKKVKSLMEQKELLLASRRGITKNFTEQEKPTFTPEELYSNRKRGISFSSLGKKLGIDNTKEEVVNVFKVMQECDRSLPDVEKIDTPILKSYPTSLWFLFDSELDAIAADALPHSSYFSTSGLYRRLSSCLGDRGVELVSSYLVVNSILREEIATSIESSDPNNALGKLEVWTNGLPSKLLAKCSHLFEDIAKAALCHTTEFKEFVGDSRCQCGGVKYLKCTWASMSVPSFFWGCVQYRVSERFAHDRARAFRSANVKLVLENSQYYSRMVHKDIAHISRMLDEEKKIHVDEVKNDRISKLFGPSSSPEPDINVNEMLQKYIDIANTIAKEREDCNLALLAQINEGIPKEQDMNIEEDVDHGE